jgi:hypothetical protein
MQHVPLCSTKISCAACPVYYAMTQLLDELHVEKPDLRGVHPTHANAHECDGARNARCVQRPTANRRARASEIRTSVLGRYFRTFSRTVHTLLPAYRRYSSKIDVRFHRCSLRRQPSTVPGHKSTTTVRCVPGHGKKPAAITAADVRTLVS